MKRCWPLAACLGLLVACHQQQNVRREVWPPPGSEPAEPTVAEVPPPPPKVLDPVLVAVSEKSTVGQVRRQLGKDNPDKARDLAEAALRDASAVEKGRLHWLAATAALELGSTQAALGHLLLQLTP